MERLPSVLVKFIRLCMVARREEIPVKEIDLAPYIQRRDTARGGGVTPTTFPFRQASSLDGEVQSDQSVASTLIGSGFPCLCTTALLNCSYGITNVHLEGSVSRTLLAGNPSI